MKRLVRFSVMFAVIALLVLGSALSTFAQGGDNPLCSGLSDEDCQLLSAASTSMDGVTSFAIPAWSVNLTFASGTDTGSFVAAGSGHIVLPADPADPMAGLLVHLVIDDATSTSGTDTKAGAGEILIRDGMVFVNWNGEWFGEEMTEEDLAEFQGMFGGGEGGMGLDQLGIDLTGVATTTRTDQDGMALFTTNVDINLLLNALLASPALGSLMGADPGMAEMTPEQLQAMGAMIAPMLTGTTISFGQVVNPEDSTLRGVRVDATLGLDLTMFDPEAGSITGEFHFSADFDQFNEAFDVPAPESFRPLEELDTEGALPLEM